MQNRYSLSLVRHIRRNHTPPLLGIHLQRQRFITIATLCVFVTTSSSTSCLFFVFFILFWHISTYKWLTRNWRTPRELLWQFLAPGSVIIFSTPFHPVPTSAAYSRSLSTPQLNWFVWLDFLYASYTQTSFFVLCTKLVSPERPLIVFIHVFIMQC